MAIPLATLLTALLTAAATTTTTTAAPNVADCVGGPLASNKVCDASASPSDRARALVAALKTEEKFDLVVNQSPGVPRLGLPSYNWWQESLHGLAASPGVTFERSGDFSYATSFPQPILMGAAFDDDLIEAVATVVSTEARAFYNFNKSGLDFWTPNINPYRDPRWGRGQETPGEDAFHLKAYVKSLVKGLQGGINPDKLKVVATCKHFAAYDLENWMGQERYGFDARITTQELSEYYMQPFKACARDAKVSSFMCSYNALNGVPACASSYLLQDLLRQHWNWTDDGFYVTSDCDSIQNVYKPHNYAPTREAVAAAALKAGTDLNCGTYYRLFLPGALGQGLLDESDLDRAIVRLYTAQVKLGMFDRATAWSSLTFADVNTQHAQELALRAAEEGIVLLKNDGTLPLRIPTDRNFTIAVIGPYANATEQMQGNYAGVAPYLHSPWYAATRLPNVSVVYAGSPGDPTTTRWPEFIRTANASDFIIYADGFNGGEESDRNLIRWPGERQDVMTIVAGLGKPFVLVQMGDLVDHAPFLDDANVSAILWAGFPGQAGGDAIVNIITGKTAPAGRLPVTLYPADYVDQIPMTDMNLRPNATSGNPGRTYKWYDQATLPFGFGLHYTNFTVSLTEPPSPTSPASFEIATVTAGCDTTAPAGLEQCRFRTVAIRVHNTGTGSGSGSGSDYVALGFISGQHGPAPHPIKELVAYRRLVDVAPGEARDAHLHLTLGSLARHDERGRLVLYPGSYSLLLDVPTRAVWPFRLTGEPVVLDEWPQEGRGAGG